MSTMLPGKMPNGLNGKRLGPIQKCWLLLSEQAAEAKDDRVRMVDHLSSQMQTTNVKHSL